MYTPYIMKIKYGEKIIHCSIVYFASSENLQKIANHKLRNKYVYENNIKYKLTL